MAQVALEAAHDQRRYYDARYRSGYMQDFSHVFEATRRRQVAATVALLRRSGLEPHRALDYGCGEGRWFALLKQAFPNASIAGCDISKRALELAGAQWPQAHLTLMDDERAPLPERAFDMIISIEVLEHVGDVRSATGEIGRLLAPEGTALITTPCANRGSLEWALNRARGGLQPTTDGYGRFATDEPSHLRRLRARDLHTLLADAGLLVERVLYSGHLFTTLIGAIPGLRPRRLRAGVGMLDWRLFRRLPNGSTMVVVARKR
jgi:SAM-dependent methyltransferase